MKTTNQSKYLKVTITDNEYIVILMDFSGNEFGKGCGVSTIEAINNYYENNDINLGLSHVLQ